MALCIYSRIKSRTLLHYGSLYEIALRCKSGKFKTKIAKTGQVKTASMMALDHFDFYYGPMFGKNWSSVRLGLTSPNKFIAVVNRFSEECNVNEEIIKDLGTVNLIEQLTKGMDTASERLSKKKELTNKKAIVFDDDKTSLDNEPQDKENDAQDLVMRQELGLGEFEQPKQSFTLGQLQTKQDGKKDIKGIQITGLEGQYATLPKKEDFIYYPRNLKLYSFPRASLQDFPAPWIDKKQVSGWWLLDGGSVVPVLAMDLALGEHVLDMCSAPGGKSLLMLQTGLLGKLVCNDQKMSRLGQLRRGLSMYVPETCSEADKIILKRKDGGDLATWDELSLYDKVIADVPCSTDRLAANQDEGNMFSKQMTNERLNLPELQTKILINGLRSAKIGGTVIYSTCSLSPLQNESVVENACAVAERDFGIQCVEKDMSQLKQHLTSTGLYRFSDQCKRGLLVLPFLPSNFGPMYVCKLTRTS